MIVKYPEHLPLPNMPGQDAEIGYGLGRTSIPTALAKQRKYFNAPRIDKVLAFGMTNDTYVEWIAWMRDHGDSWFDIQIVSSRKPVDIMATHRVRVSTPYEYTKAGDNWIEVSVGVELVPGDAEDPLVSRPEYDWIVAGNPQYPAADEIRAGAPATPSTEGPIAPHLYYW